MGGIVATRPLDILDYTSQVHWRDTLFNDLWSQGCYLSGDWVPNAKNEFFHSVQQ